MLKELIKVIQQERYTYSDPVTEFLECLYVNYDFEGAQKKLRECEEVRLGLSIMQQSSFVWSTISRQYVDLCLPYLSYLQEHWTQVTRRVLEL